MRPPPACLERFFFKRSGHFGCHHAAKVFFKAHGKHAVVFIVIYGDDGRDIFRQSSRNPRFLACDGTPAQQQHEQAEGKRSEPSGSSRIGGEKRDMARLRGGGLKDDIP